MNFDMDGKTNSDSASCFELITGYSDTTQFKQKAESFISICGSQNIFLNAKIDSPAFEMAEYVLSFVPGNDIMRLDESVIFKIIDNIFKMLSLETKSKITNSLMKTFIALKAKNTSSTQIKNAFIRTVCSLNTDFAELLKNLDKNKYMFFEGELNKYDFITLNVLYMLGVNGMIICFNNKKPDFLIEPLFVITDGQYKTKLDFQPAKKAVIPAELHRNQWFNFSRCSDIETYIDSLLDNNEDRLQNGYKVLSLNFLGVSDKQKYEFAVNKFYISLTPKRRLFVLDATFANPTYNEIQKFNDLNYSSKTIEEILGNYVPLRETSFPFHVNQTVDFLLSEKHFNNSSQKNNFERIIHLWLIRICDTFFLDKTSLDHIPVIIIWGSVSNRISDFLRCVENMPIDIIQFLPNKESGFSPETQKTIDLGPANPEITNFPYELKKLARHETVAFNAEQEIRNVLSTGLTTFYQMKQFKELNPVVLKTTFEEIDIIWKEPAKFRPSFSTAGDIVTIPSIFAKINGVKDSVESYIAGIQAKITTDTLLIDKFPYMPPCTDPSALDFMKHVYFKDNIDIEKIKNSQYYNYGLFSIETQNVIIKGIIDFFKNNWYAKKRLSFDYNALECLLRLPHNVIQLIHNFSFTENIPKVIVFNATNTPCSAEDCIVIMFLKALGFDAIIYAPTGYRVIEEYINDGLFNNINIGPYNYDLANVDIKSKMSQKKKRSLRKLFLLN